MKLALAPLLLALQAAPLLAVDHIVTLGDSLTFAYEGEFGFKITIPFVGTYGDGFGSSVRNWIEILGAPAYRNAYFDQGSRKSITLLGKTLFLRQEYNWAIPGLKIDEMRRFVLGQASLLDLLEESDNFATLGTALSLSDFDEDEDFNVTDMNDQIRNTAQRLVFFIGGNDVRGIYGDVYDGGSAGTFTDDFISDATAILDRVRELNPNIQLVVVAVPHIGITPDIKSSWPTDPVKTGRVTALLQDLNTRLATVAKQHNAEFADVFSTTLSLLQSAPLCLHGLTFTNTGSTSGDLNYVWLNGPLSANFHPNTNAQAVIANTIVRSFNKRYHTGIAPLSATEMLGGLLGKSASQIDMTFANWATGFGLTGLAETSDSDGDGVPAGIEFAVGLDPTQRDGDQIASAVVPVSGGSALELAFAQRLPASTRFTLQATQSTTLTSPFTAVTPAPTAGTDGLLRAQLPISGASRGFLRLESTVAP